MPTIRKGIKFSALFAAVALLVLISDAHSQRQRAQPPPPADQRGTEQSPLVVKVMPSEEETAKQDLERKEKSEIDRKLVDFNGNLTYFTRFLAWLAGLQSKPTNIPAENAAPARIAGWSIVRQIVTGQETVNEFHNPQIWSEHGSRYNILNEFFLTVIGSPFPEIYARQLMASYGARMDDSPIEQAVRELKGLDQ